MEQFPNYAFWLEAGNMMAVRPLHLMHNVIKKLSLCVMRFMTNLPPFHRMDVTVCVAPEIGRTPRPTGEWPQNRWKKSQRREMTTCYLCDLNTSEMGQKCKLCDTVHSFTSRCLLLGTSLVFVCAGFRPGPVDALRVPDLCLEQRLCDLVFTYGHVTYWAD